MKHWDDASAKRSESMRDVGLIVTFSGLFISLTAYASPQSFVMQCFEPSGLRLEAQEDTFTEDSDGYTNSNPTFYWSATQPNVLKEVWQAANPFPSEISRSEVDKLVPPTASKSQVLRRNESVVHALDVSGSSSESYTTTLYLAEEKAVFTRVQIEISDSFTHRPMVSAFAADCEIRWLE